MNKIALSRILRVCGSVVFPSFVSVGTKPRLSFVSVGTLKFEWFSKKSFDCFILKLFLLVNFTVKKKKRKQKQRKIVLFRSNFIRKLLMFVISIKNLCLASLSSLAYLFDAKEKRLLKRLNSLSNDQISIVVKILNRIHRPIRLCKTDWSPSDVNAILQSGLAESLSPSIQDALALLTKPELSLLLGTTSKTTMKVSELRALALCLPPDSIPKTLGQTLQLSPLFRDTITRALMVHYLVSSLPDNTRMIHVLIMTTLNSQTHVKVTPSSPELLYLNRADSIAYLEALKEGHALSRAIDQKTGSNKEEHDMPSLEYVKDTYERWKRVDKSAHHSTLSYLDQYTLGHVTSLHLLVGTLWLVDTAKAIEKIETKQLKKSVKFVISRKLASDVYRGLAITILEDLMARHVLVSRRGKMAYNLLCLFLITKQYDRYRDLFEYCRAGHFEVNAKYRALIKYRDIMHFKRKKQSPWRDETISAEKVECLPKVKGKARYAHGNDESDNETITVEQVVIHHYKSLGYSAIHCESAFFRMLFGLLYFEAIFEPVFGVWPFPASCPLDFNSSCFVSSRLDTIEAIKQKILNGQGAAMIQSVFDTQYESKTDIIGVNWDLLLLSDWLDIVALLSVSTLLQICECFLYDYRGHSPGVPDLLVWSVEKKQVMFVEVKGDGDTLSEMQREWLIRLNEMDGISASIMRVSGGKA